MQGMLHSHLREATVHPSEVALECLGFVLGKERYALPLSSVREIMRMPKVTEVPRGPRDVLGIVSVRGEITTIVDLRRRLLMEERPVGPRTRVLLVDHQGEILGLVVDRVLQVYRLHAEEIEPASVLGSEAGPHVTGIGRPGWERGVEVLELSDEGILILLDPFTLLKQYGGR